MNNKEYYNSEINRKNPEYQQVHELLKEWKERNNYTCNCIVHHRDDTEECRKYNEEHYELWGFNLDGTFEYGKYVIFMTRAGHSTYHNTGEKNPMYGKSLSDEHRAKISAALTGENHPMYGKHLSEEVKTKMSAALTGENHPMYGKHHSEETRAKISIAHQGKHHSEEARAKISIAHQGGHLSSETKAKLSAVGKAISTLWHAYKNNNGKLSYNEFRAALKNGEITFETHPISVFVK